MKADMPRRMSAFCWWSHVMLAEVAGKDTRTVFIALSKRAKKRPKELYKSLSWDRNLQSSSLCVGDQNRRRFLIFSKEPVAARIGREHQWPTETVLTKRHALSVHTQGNLNKVARQLNERPRETSQFKTTAEKSNALCCVDRLSRQFELISYSRRLGVRGGFVASPGQSVRRFNSAGRCFHI
jgi:hypothetical protein